MGVETMLNKLDYAEKAQLFNGLSVLEKKYGKEKTKVALEKMVDVLEGTKEEPKEQPKQYEQTEMEIGQDNKRVRKRSVTKQEAEEVARILGYPNLNMLLIEKYYKKGELQRGIAKTIGCGQRSVSRWINEIPKSQLQKEMK